MIAQIELWTLRSLAALALLGVLAFFVYTRGAESVQRKWDAAEVERKAAEESQNARNMADTIARQGKVAAAEAAAAQAASELAVYRRTHPLTLLACRLHTAPADHPANPGQGAGDGAAAAGGNAGGVVQPPDTRDLGSELDEFAAQADAINSAYRICLATRPGAH